MPWYWRIIRWGDVAVFLVLATVVFTQEPWGVRTVVGLAVAAAGLLLWVTARLQLGGSFSLRPEARRLVTTGLYARFRHPVYLFGQIAYLGLAIAWSHWIGYAWLGLAGVMQVVRVVKEDRVLERAFGEEYRRYRAGTWF